MSKICSLFLNGDYLAGSDYAPEGMIIAVDGGLRHLLERGLVPAVLVGDLDSVNPDDLAMVRSTGSEVIQFPVKKDQTDFELALDVVAKYKPKKVLIHGALGGRIDHILANMGVFCSPKFADMDLQIISENQNMHIIRSSLIVRGHPGDLISLIPFGGPVEGVTTRLLEYPLEKAHLEATTSRGISNVMLENTAEIQISRGTLLCVHTSLS